MYRALRGATGIACVRLGFISVQHKKLDKDRLSEKIENDSDFGVDRIAKIFGRDELGSISPEAAFINIFGFTGGFVGAMYGGLLNSRFTHTTFRESNEATLFYSNKAAQRKLLDAMTIGFGKGAVRWGIRYGIFSYSFAGLTTLISRFRGESGILEYSVGGLISGALYKFMLGPKGMISGGLLGAFIGTIGGATLYGLSKITGFTMDDVYRLSYVFVHFQDMNFHGASRIHLETKDIILEHYHPKGYGSMENTLNELEDISENTQLKYSKNTIPIATTASNKSVKQ